MHDPGAELVDVWYILAIYGYAGVWDVEGQHLIYTRVYSSCSHL
jgi:hypothetical protein